MVQSDWYLHLYKTALATTRKDGRLGERKMSWERDSSLDKRDRGKTNEQLSGSKYFRGNLLIEYDRKTRALA